MKYIEPISFYNNKKPLLFYLVDCGSGLTHLIVFPDRTVMLFDCNLVDDTSASGGMNKEQILNFFKRVIPKKQDINGNIVQNIDIFVNSHRDTDHLKGLKEVNKKFPIQSIWDSGCTGENSDNLDYQYYMRLRRTLKNKNLENVLMPTPDAKCFKEFGDAKVYCLCDSKDYKDYESIECFNESADKEQHTNCMVLLIAYANIKMLLTGDSGWEAWRDKIVPNFKGRTIPYANSDILIASHHGSKSFFTGAEKIDKNKNPDNTFLEHIEQINPKITLISCGKYSYKDYHLPNDEAMKLYKKYTSGKQVYTTNELGTFCGRINLDESFSVTPASFHNSFEKKIRISCTDETGQIIKNGEACETGKKLHFKVLNGTEKFISSGSKLSVFWQVCNSGQSKDITHHEIYCKGKDELEDKFSFARDLSYVGTHLLRCTVKNSKKGFQTAVFVIHGV